MGGQYRSEIRRIAAVRETKIIDQRRTSYYCFRNHCQSPGAL